MLLINSCSFPSVHYGLLSFQVLFSLGLKSTYYDAPLNEAEDVFQTQALLETSQPNVLVPFDGMSDSYVI